MRRTTRLPEPCSAQNSKTLQVRSFITQDKARISFRASIRMWIYAQGEYKGRRAR